MKFNKEDELNLWHDYKFKGNKESAKALYESSQPLIKSYLNPYYYSGVPVEAIDSYSRELFVGALDTFDPNRAQLNTHIQNSLRNRMSRYVLKYQNTSRMTEKKKSNINVFKSVSDDLTVELGRPPSVSELADELSWPEKQVQDMQKNLRRDLSASELELSGGNITKSFNDARTAESFRLLYYDSSGQEQVVLEHTWGWNNKPKLTSKDIARRLNVSEAKVSQLRTRLAKKFEKIHGGKL